MYVTNSIYDSFARYVDVDDRTFFSTALECAKSKYTELLEADRSQIKQLTPVCFISSLSSQKESEKFVQRKILNTDRARRKFIMIDADFQESAESESIRMQENLKALAEKYKTPLMIYPTVSYPDKPRFRAVLLVKRGLSPSKYWCAMTWLYKEIGFNVLDKSDLRISANRNLPVFCNDDQISAIYSTFDDLSLEPLDNKLWADIAAPKKNELSADQLKDLKEVSYDEDELIKGAKLISTRQIAKSYETFWHLVASIAAAVVLEQIDEDLALELLDEFAEAGENDSQKAKWRAGNNELYQQFVTQYREIPENISKARQLHSYSEFLNASSLKKGGKNE